MEPPKIISPLSAMIKKGNLHRGANLKMRKLDIEERSYLSPDRLNIEVLKEIQENYYDDDWFHKTLIKDLTNDQKVINLILIESDG